MIARLEPDTYGQYARASLLADYVELLALKRKGREVRKSIVADFLADNDWNLELIDLPADGQPDVGLATALSERRDDAGSAASIVFDQIKERHDVLKQSYPFDVSDRGVSLRSDFDHESSSYVAALALTIAHAFRVLPLEQVASLFERVVTTVLRRRGLPSVCLAEIRRSGHSFEDALTRACEAVGLKAAPSAAPTLAHAHDEGVDVLCHLGWDGEELRAGTWGFIGQVTVGRSDTWPRKIKEPSPSSWSRRIGTRIRPLPFLAVPHHVEQPMMEKLTVDGEGVVLDRLRLVRFKEDVDGDEQVVIRAVAGADIEPLVGWESAS